MRDTNSDSVRLFLKRTKNRYGVECEFFMEEDGSFVVRKTGGP